MTRSQRRALDAYWSRFGLESSGVLDLDAIFGRRALRFLEIGFGMGDALLAMASENPGHDYLGVEVYEPGIGSLLRRLAATGVGNARVIRRDAIALLQESIPDQSLAGASLFFPDPWPKKRHHKRRIVQPFFVSLVASKLCPGGRFHLATDWEEYAQQMLDVLEAEPALVNCPGAGHFHPRPSERPKTKFECRGARLGHAVRDLVFERPRDVND